MKELAAALVKARVACPATVHKSAKNNAQGYQYVGHEQVLVSGAREALLAHGLVLEQKRVEFVGTEMYKTSKGENACWRWRGTFALIHTSGEEREYVFEATTGANDKAAFVASTALDRTAYMRICALAGSAEENPEHDSHDRLLEAAAKPVKVAKTLDDIAKGADVEDVKAREKREQIVSEYNGMYKAAVELSGLENTGECEAHGLMCPPGSCPVFGSGPDAGKAYTAVPAGKLRALLASAAFQSNASTVQKMWAAYIVALHELSKLAKQEKAA